MSKQMKKMKLSPFASLISTVVAAVELIVFCIYGAKYPVYFDIGVVAFLVLSIAGAAGYVFWDSSFSQWLNLISVFCGSFAMGLIFLNSYTVWADWYGGFTMYGSQGGIVPVIILLVFAILSIVAGIVSCFTNKGGDRL